MVTERAQEHSAFGVEAAPVSMAGVRTVTPKAGTASAFHVTIKPEAAPRH
jgi:hypothetical protein